MQMTKESLIQAYLAKGYALFPCNGKLPLVKAWQKTEYNPFLSVEDFPKNFGVNLQDDDLVIDIDVNGDKKGKASFRKLTENIGFNFSTATIVKTGSGGFHVYLKKPADMHVKETFPNIYPNLEFKSKGRYVIGAGSVHPDTEKEYKLVQGELTSIIPAPINLLNLIHSQISIENTDKQSPLKSYVDDEQSIGRCRAYLERMEGAVQGLNGDKNTYMVVCRCRSFGISPRASLELLLSEWNQKCSPPWTEKQLLTKVENAYKYDTLPLGSNHPGSDFADVPVKKNYKWNSPPKKDGSRTVCLLHCVNYFDMNGNLTDLFSYNMFTKDIVFTRTPNWYPADEKPASWSDDDAVEAKYILSNQNKFEPNINIIHESALIMAKQKPFHPLRDYLTSLKWDRTPRIDSWLTTYAFVEETDYTKTVGLKTLLAGVARVIDPGCEYHNVLILEGGQGVGKTRLVKALGGEWYGDILIDPHKPDTVAAMRNKWIIEISELVAFRKTEINALKSFISRSEDRVRLAYRKNTEDFPRQCIFIGTVNPDKGGYLQDSTGNRRFWPVEIPKDKKVNVDGIIEDRDQLWAEALHRYRAGETDLYIEDNYTNDLAAIEVEKRRPKDSWFEILVDYINKLNEDGSVKEHLTSTEIFCDCLNGALTRFGRYEQSRIAQVMGELGWEYKVFHDKKLKKPMRGFVRPEEAE